MPVSTCSPIAASVELHAGGREVPLKCRREVPMQRPSASTSEPPSDYLVNPSSSAMTAAGGCSTPRLRCPNSACERVILPPSASLGSSLIIF